jgi:hypothetical protein
MSELKRELANRIEETPIHQHFKIKIVDFLGKSRWKFVLSDGRTITARILDDVWLAKFHAHSETIGSGDSIEIDGIVKDTYDESGNLLDSEYTINHVVKLHNVTKGEQEFDF